MNRRKVPNMTNKRPRIETVVAWMRGEVKLEGTSEKNVLVMLEFRPGVDDGEGKGQMAD